MGSRFLRWIFGALSALLIRREVEGWENLPAQGPYILAMNHLSIFDAPVVFGLLGSEDTTGWAAEKYEHHPIFGALLRMGRGIFIQRGEVDRKALQAAVQWLKAGRIFGLAPEGTRSKTGALMRGKVGVVYLAQEADVPVVPAAVMGTEEVGGMLKRLRRARVVVRFGRPFRLAPLEDRRSSSLRAQADEVMCRIAALLLPKYRGVYADRPRVKELLSQAEAS